MNALLDIFQQGGFLMWPLCLISLTIWFIVLQQMQLLFDAGRFSFESAEHVLTIYQVDGIPAAQRSLENARGLLAEALRDALARPLTLERIDRAFFDAEIRLQARHDMLDALVQVAPLLGLLGTVVGMVAAFDVLHLVGVSDPRALSGGISQALLTTQAGLLIAVPGLLGRVLLTRKERKLLADLHGLRLMLIGQVKATPEDKQRGRQRSTIMLFDPAG